MTEKEKGQNGLWYDANFDPELLQLRNDAERIYCEYNKLPSADAEKGQALLKKLLPDMGDGVTVLAPFYTDYGYNITIGDGTYINHGAYLMDCAKITIGKNCFIGPNCGMYTASHPLLASERNKGFEIAKPITIGDNVWFGGNVVVLPGVTIGHDTVIGAGSVVTKDIPSGVVAVGSPCHVLRQITEADSIRNTPEWQD